MSNIVPLRTVRRAPGLEALLLDDELVAEVSRTLKEGAAWIVPGAVDPDFLRRFRTYLESVARSSLPNYQAIVEKAPNFHRVYGDPRSYVEGRFHQFSFFPWNQDVFDLFSRFADVYRANNRINGWPEDKYLGAEPEEDCTARITVQAYPKGVGYIKRHTDAVGPHKFTTVSCCMSEKGLDYADGGLVVQGDDGADVNLDVELRLGDLVWIHSHVPHEVALIDPGTEPDWLALSGKWTAICAVNKLAGTSSVENSSQID